MYLHRAVEAGDEEMVGVLAANAPAVREAADVDLGWKGFLHCARIGHAAGHGASAALGRPVNSMPSGERRRQPPVG
jgi:hypothetical protein